MKADTLEFPVPPDAERVDASVQAGAAAEAALDVGARRARGGLRIAGRGPDDVAAAARAWLARDASRAAALTDSWRAFWVSRVLVWIAGVSAFALLGLTARHGLFDPAGATHALGSVGNYLWAPASRWDSAWYIAIAEHGYNGVGALPHGYNGDASTAFFPLYPLLVAAVGSVGWGFVLAGVLVSLVFFFAALYLTHRLAQLELGATYPGAARMAVFVTALFPTAFFFSSVYSESMYLVVSLAAFWFARHGRWGWASAMGALAAGSRSVGVVLLVPLVMLYLYGPRTDRSPDVPLPGDLAAARRARRIWLRLRPRYRLRPDALWFLLVPAGLAAYLVYLGFNGHSALAPFHVQQVWYRHFAGPFGGIWYAAVAAFDGMRQLLSFSTAHRYFVHAGGNPLIAASHNVTLFLFFVAAVPLVIATLRRLPLAYGVYVLAALALPLSYPVKPQPLMSLSRFLVVLFPLALCMGAWLSRRPRWSTPVLVASSLLLVVFVAQFATWHWVA